jgi:hypothetical protein
LSADATVALTPADCFLRALDREIRRCNGASHNSQLVLRLGPGFDVAAFANLVREAAERQPLLKAPIARPFGIGAPVYRLDAARRAEPPRVEVHDWPGPRPTGDTVDLPILSERLNEPFDVRRGHLLRFDVVRYDGGASGTDLAMTWLHMLFDGSGSEGFLRFLDECFRGARDLGTLPVDEFGASDPTAPKSPPEPIRERGLRAREWVDHLQGFAAHPPRSLGGPLSKARQDLRHRVVRFSSEETERIVAEAARQAGVLTPMLFYLAAATRAHDAVFRARGEPPEGYLVPLPVDLRPKGAERAVFRTHVSLLWFQVLSEQTKDLSLVLQTLKDQRRNAIKHGMIEKGRAAMEFARWAPARLYSHMARRSFGGELCSFFFAYTGEFLAGVDSFLGADVESGYHVAPVPASPGSCLAMSLRDGRLGVTHVLQEGLAGREELALFDERLRADLLGGD